MTLFEKVEDLCIRNNTNISAMARKADIERQTIFFWKDRNADPRLSTLKKIADFFGVTVDSLLPDKEGSRTV